MSARRRWTQQEMSTVALLYAQEPCSVIGAQIGRSSRAVAHLAQRLGLVRTDEQQAAMDQRGRELGGETRRGRATKHGHCTAEGFAPEYRVWVSMKTRCNNPKARSFKDYGARGVKVCDRWAQDFDAFLRDMGPRPPGSTIERKDVNGDYEPGNCEWLPSKLQPRNRRTSALLEAFGRVQCMAAWAEEFGVSQRFLFNRIRRLGWPVERALTEPRVSAAEAARRATDSRWAAIGNLGELRKVRK